MEEVLEKNKVKMLVVTTDRGFRLDYMDEDDLRSLRSLIKTAGLVESRRWQLVLEEINVLLKER